MTYYTPDCYFSAHTERKARGPISEFDKKCFGLDLKWRNGFLNWALESFIALHFVLKKQYLFENIMNFH